MAAEKDQGKFGLAETSVSLYVGNTYQLEAVNAEPVTDEFGWSYSVSFSSSDLNVVRVDYWSGLVRAVGVGQADITAYYMGQTATCHVKVKAGYCELDKEKLTLYKGQETVVTLTNSKQKAVSYEYFVCRQEDNYEVSWPLQVESKGKGVFSVRGLEAGLYYLDLSLTNETRATPFSGSSSTTFSVSFIRSSTWQRTERLVSLPILPSADGRCTRTWSRVWSKSLIFSLTTRPPSQI